MGRRGGRLVAVGGYCVAHRRRLACDVRRRQWERRHRLNRDRRQRLDRGRGPVNVLLYPCYRCLPAVVTFHVERHPALCIVWRASLKTIAPANLIICRHECLPVRASRKQGRLARVVDASPRPKGYNQTLCALRW